MSNKVGFIISILLFSIGCDFNTKHQNTSPKESQDSSMQVSAKRVVILETLEAGTVQFQIYGQKLSSLDTITIIPSGFEIINDTITIPIDGHLTAAFIGDINQDDYPEFYLVATSAGSGSYATLFAYASYRNKSYGPIYIPGLDSALLIGYMGHDQYEIRDNKLLRKFPIYLPGDMNAQPTGGERVIEFDLIKGEASYILQGKEYVGAAN